MVVKKGGQRESFDRYKILNGLKKACEKRPISVVEMEDVVIVTKDDQGKVSLHQAMNLTAMGAVGGSFWGMLIGMLFLNPLLGAALGAGAGAISGALTDMGIDDKFMKELAENFKPGCAAIFILVKKATPDKLMEKLHGR